MTRKSKERVFQRVSQRRQVLLVRDGLAAVAEWESEHGALTAAELAAARSRVERRQPRRKRAPR
jgi:hypothetical protein